MASILALKLQLVAHEGPKKLLGSIFYDFGIDFGSIFNDFALNFGSIFNGFIFNFGGLGKHF